MRIANALLSAALVLASAQPAPAQTTKPSAIACDSYARDYATEASRRGQVLGGAAVGGVVGLGLGALAAASGIGLAIGATVGAIGGGAKREATARRMYEVAYQDCMAGLVR